MQKFQKDDAAVPQILIHLEGSAANPNRNDVFASDVSFLPHLSHINLTSRGDIGRWQTINPAFTARRAPNNRVTNPARNTTLSSRRYEFNTDFFFVRSYTFGSGVRPNTRRKTNRLIYAAIHRAPASFSYRRKNRLRIDHVKI